MVKLKHLKITAKTTRGLPAYPNPHLLCNILNELADSVGNIKHIYPDRVNPITCYYPYPPEKLCDKINEIADAVDPKIEHIYPREKFDLEDLERCGRYPTPEDLCDKINEIIDKLSKEENELKN